MIGKFSHLLRRSALGSFQRQLGDAASEEKLGLAADDLVPNPKYQKTMSITIEAPPRQVWPWLVQMGCRRGGWYSIDSLDNGGAFSAWQVIPELQSIQVGQVLPWKTEGDEGFSVLKIEPEKALVLGTAKLLRGPHQPGDDFNDIWSFVLEPIGEDATRLIARVRADYRPSFRMSLLGAWLRPVHRVMEHAQLVNLKRRIENPKRSSPTLLSETPRAQFRSQVEIDVDAAPEQVMEAFHGVTSRDMPIAGLLGAIRYLPARILGRKQTQIGQDEPFGKHFMESGSLELLRLATEVVIASAGKYHQVVDQEFFRFKNVDEFRSFNDPQYQKLLISVRAEPLGNHRSKLILEHWTWALSEESRRKFARYWKFIRPTGNFVSRILLHAAKKRAERDSGIRRLNTPGMGAA